MPRLHKQDLGTQTEEAMKLTENDRILLMHMAGSIAGGMCTSSDWTSPTYSNIIARESAQLALATMQAVDGLIGEENHANMDE